MRTRQYKDSLLRCCVLLTFSLYFAAPTRAQLIAPPVPIQATPLPNGLTEFARANPQCTEMTNGCEVCVRGTAVECSTPGIACQPVAWQCKKGDGPPNDSAKSTAPSK
jgi:hypothetical protein